MKKLTTLEGLSKSAQSIANSHLLFLHKALSANEPALAAMYAKNAVTNLNLVAKFSAAQVAA